MPQTPVTETELDIAAVLDTEIHSGHTTVYASAFQLAWNVLVDTRIHEPIRFQDEPPLVGRLNERLFTASDLDPDAYFVFSGPSTAETYAEMRKLATAKFPDLDPDLPKPEEESYFAYGYLEKNLALDEHFDRLARPIWFEIGEARVPIAAFGIDKYVATLARHARLSKQVAVHDYRDADNFVLVLQTVSTNDEVVLARVPPESTLAATVSAVRNRIARSSAEHLHDEDSLLIPIINVALHHEYSELTHKRLLNAGKELWQLASARQVVRFRLSESGVMVKAEASMEFTLNGNRDYVFDGPFLIYLRERRSEVPYFAVWVASADLLLQAGEAEAVVPRTGER